MRKVAVILMLAALAACGQRSALGLQPGQQLPPAPYGRADRPAAAELLKLPTQAIPERSVELRTRSEQREDDPFDLPPPESPQPEAAKPESAKPQ
ncbi:hypothetical protein [Novosphingobium sp. P6W]|jgi:predicted small lipoprotein YifL|uniref:hypothetical protein n=1 Tax=Novosphingobium sp. P6W TaxID=1609758 RepID=UPI0005C31A8B|nr:hypothetical protein [Novosphingobium sp. P6W]AXB77679.1 hypothetical protein TQ38_015175 [Novosphingobium sp. P6W]KIS34027.1 argininosuccinate lyase [Novosphingobium sp. P6W]